jgi:radical SAM protein with 4Fe4S-binding SPASM domain
LDKRVFDLIDVGKECLPTTRFVLVTNGSLLTEKRIDRILGSRLDRIRISVNAFRQETFALLGSGLDFDRIVKGTERLLEGSKVNGRPSVVASMVEMRPNTAEVRQFADHWSRLGAQVHVSPAWNRAGNLPAQNSFQLAADGQTGWLCTKPFTDMVITYDGRAVLCCGDYSADVVLGNVNSESIHEIWLGPRHKEELERMLKKENALCHKCDKLTAFRTYER